MTKNRGIANFFFDAMTKMGYEPYDIEFGNGYFIMDYGEDSVVHFRVKGLWKHWKFGMWIFSEYLDKPDEEKDKFPFVEIFAQYDTQIDKFKPSRSDLCVEFKASHWNESEENNGLYLGLLRDMLGMMKRHPFICYDGFCGEFAWYTTRSFIWNFVKQESRELRRTARKAAMIAIFLPYTKAKIFFAKRAKCVKSIELHDFEKEHPGWSTSYLYEVRVTFNKDSTDELESKWLDRWFRKDNYGKFEYYDHVISLDSFLREGLDGAYTYDRKSK